MIKINTIKSKESLEEKLGSRSASVAMTGIADTAGNISYSLVVGSMLDFAAGLNLTGIAASRASAVAMNLATGALYGGWRNKVYGWFKTDENSSRVKKYLTELFAFNTGQVPIYAAAVSIASLVSEGRVDFAKVKSGAEYLAMVSPLIGPTMGWYMDKVRKTFGVQAAEERIGKALISESDRYKD